MQVCGKFDGGSPFSNVLFGLVSYKSLSRISIFLKGTFLSGHNSYDRRRTSPDQGSGFGNNNKIVLSDDMI